jgi:carboxylesterase
LTLEEFTDRSETDQRCREARSQAREAGVSCDDNLPFLIGPKDADIAVLMIHGFTATPWEMRLLGEFLARDGISCLAVRLPGHGTTPEDLARCRWQDWLASVNEGHTLLAARHPHVFGLGMSTGCLLLLASALEQTFQGLVLCSPYLRIKNRLAAYAGWLRWLRPYQNKEPRSPDPHYYDRRPVAGVDQINRLVKQLRPHLADCRTPVLAFNGEGDQTVEVESGRDLVMQLGSLVRIYQRYGEEIPHVMVREENPCYAGMFSLIRTFIRETIEPGEFRRADEGRGR